MGTASVRAVTTELHLHSDHPRRAECGGGRRLSRGKVDSNPIQKDSNCDQRAALFIEREFAGPHRNKRIAALFGVSPSHAKNLRVGKAWRKHHPALVRAFGWRFLSFVYELAMPPPADALHDEIGRLRERLRALEDACAAPASGRDADRAKAREA